MRQRFARPAALGFIVSASMVLAFAVAPVHAAPPPQANPSWGDITSVIAGPGLTGGTLEGDATLAALFGGNGSADSVARSDHNHDALYDARYAPLNHSHEGGGDHNHDGVYAPFEHLHDDLYSPLAHMHDDAYSPLGHNHNDLYAVLNHDHDSLYSALNHNHDNLYSPLGHNHDGAYSALGHNHDDLYLGLGGGTLNGFLTLAMGDLTLLGSGARLVAPQLVSTAPSGTAPLEVGSDTVVTNLNADKLDGHDASEFALAGSGGLPPHTHPEYASLAGSNAFTGVNTFNAPTTFAAAFSQVTGGANFTWQPFYTSGTNYSLRLTDTGKSATRLMINQDGRVGIGTTSPGFALHVVGDVRATNLNLGGGVLSQFGYDMASSTDKTFAITNSNGGVGHLSVEGDVFSAGYHVTTGGTASRAGSDAIPSGSSSRTIATTAIGSSSLVFVTPDATGAGCVAAPGPLYLSARNAGTSFTVSVVGAAPGAGESYCFAWWVVN